MKRIFTVLALFASMFIMNSCGGGASTPGDAAVEYMGYIQDGKYAEYVEGIYKSPEDSKDAEKIEKEVAQFVAMLEVKAPEMLEKKDGIKSIELVSETISEDGKKANVKLMITYGNGEEKEEKSNLILDENGEWKMSMKK